MCLTAFVRGNEYLIIYFSCVLFENNFLLYCILACLISLNASESLQQCAMCFEFAQLDSKMEFNRIN